MDIRKQYNLKSLKRRKSVYKMLFPKTLQNQYRKLMVKIVNEYVKYFRIKMYPHLSELKNKYKRDSWFDDLETLMKSINLEFSRKLTVSEIGLLIKRTGKDISSWNKKEMDNYFKTVLDMPVFFEDAGIDKILNNWTGENVKRITNLVNETSQKVEESLITDIKNGETIETIKENLMGTDLDKGIFNKLETRAELIARDQTGKLYAEITEKRQTDLGITEYIWQTAEDERVRPEHTERNGQTFSWDNPPEGGHPGEDFQCRCLALPIIPE